MEATGAVVVLLFIFTIFSSLGGKVAQPELKAPMQIVQIGDVAPVPASYTAVADSQTQDAVLRYVTAHAKKISRDDIDTLVNAIMKYSQQYDVNPKLVAALIDRESGFDPVSVSPSNAQGLAQLLPSTAAGIGIRDPFDIDEGTKGAALYIKMMLDHWAGYPNQVVLALASYAEGYNKVTKEGGRFTDATGRYIRDILVKANSIS